MFPGPYSQPDTSFGSFQRQYQAELLREKREHHQTKEAFIGVGTVLGLIALGLFGWMIAELVQKNRRSGVVVYSPQDQLPYGGGQPPAQPFAPPVQMQRPPQVMSAMELGETPYLPTEGQLGLDHDFALPYATSPMGGPQSIGDPASLNQQLGTPYLISPLTGGEAQQTRSEDALTGLPGTHSGMKEQSAVVELTEGNWDSVMGKLTQASSPAVVLFHHPECPPCKAFRRRGLYDQAAQQQRQLDGTQPFYHFDVSKSPKFAVERGVETIPTVLVLRGNQVVGKIQDVSSLKSVGDILQLVPVAAAPQQPASK